MRREELPRDPLPPFVKLRTIPDMTKIATKLVMAKKAVKEMGKIENVLLRGNVSEGDFNLATKEIARYANIVASSTNDAVKFLKIIRGKVGGFRKVLGNAVN